jgi:outer membrane lipoprotein-sorting protein
MNRLKMGAITALAVISLAALGCQNQGADTESIEDAVESLMPSMDMTMPSGSDDMDASMEPSPSGS